MSASGNSIPYKELVDIADKLLEESDYDVDLLARGLDAVEPGIRSELLVSDLLNAYQVFYYFFRTVPDELVMERMELESASSLVRGLKIDEIDLLELIFVVKNTQPSIMVSDGEKVLATFTGKTAYAAGVKYVKES